MQSAPVHVTNKFPIDSDLLPVEDLGNFFSIGPSVLKIRQKFRCPVDNARWFHFSSGFLNVEPSRFRTAGLSAMEQSGRALGVIELRWVREG